MEVLRDLADDVAIKTAELGGGEFIRYMEDTLSNALRITERTPITIASAPKDPDEEFPELDRLFRTHVNA